jgi:DNA-binding NarL/FixJ family response regulator
MQRDTPIRILIVDDHPLVREGLAARLSSVPGIDVVGDAGSAAQALEQLPRLQPDLLLTDIGMKEMNGIELTRLVTQQHPQVAVLILSMYDNPEYVQQSLQAGARGYVLKDAPSTQIVAAIESVAAGGTYLSPGVAGRLFAQRSVERTLSQREREILDHLARGHSSKQIARELDISVRTVESHRQSIKRKLNLEGQAELIKYAVERARP